MKTNGPRRHNIQVFDLPESQDFDEASEEDNMNEFPY
jgi:hypothetical protein